MSALIRRLLARRRRQASAAAMETVSTGSPRGSDRPCIPLAEHRFREQQTKEGTLSC
jgi:hypothetical protein